MSAKHNLFESFSTTTQCTYNKAGQEELIFFSLFGMAAYLLEYYFMPKITSLLQCEMTKIAPFYCCPPFIFNNSLSLLHFSSSFSCKLLFFSISFYSLARSVSSLFLSLCFWFFCVHIRRSLCVCAFDLYGYTHWNDGQSGMS